MSSLLIALSVALTFPATEPTLAEELRPLIADHPGKVAVALKNLDTGESFEHNADVPMPTASLIKLPIMVEAYRQATAGSIRLDAMVTLHQEDKVPGSGILTPHFSPGATLSVRDAIRLMIAFSDNTATNLVIDQIGISSTAQTMEQMGWPNTKLHSKVYRRDTTIFPERSQKYGLGSTTAAEMVSLLEKLERCQLVSVEASQDMLHHLLACEDKETFPKHLPKGAKIAHKTGSVTGVRTNAGLIYTKAGPVAVCVLTAENQTRPEDREEPGQRLCAEVARIVYEHFSK